jgi:NADH:ubiquinone oxidoreductase subunit K
MLLQPVFAVMASAAILTFLIQRKHFLMTLLSLEAITLISVGLIAASIGNTSELDITLFIIVISFAAVEARLGLSILVSISRKAGSELLKSLTSRKC